MDYIIDNEGFYIIDGEKYTKEEFHEEFFICSHCDKAFCWDDAIECNSDGEDYCEDCADLILTKCERCGKYYLSDDISYLEDSDYLYCEDCIRYISYYYCEHCGRRFRYSGSGEFDRYDDWYCDACIEDGYGNFSSGLIGAYHDFKCDSDALEFMGEEKRQDSPFMGFELEVDGEGDESKAANYIDSHFGNFFHMEEDGSLDSGFEIISQPASLEYHMSRMSDYSNMFKELVGCGYTSHNSGTCGLHVHIDREYFGSKLDSSIAKMLYIFEKHWDNLVRFSRRTRGQVDDWCGRYNDKPTTVVKGTKRRGYYISRYHAVNLTNDNTIEIRLWRGTLRNESFEATLKLTARIAKLCKEKTAIELRKMNFEQIIGDDETIKSYWETVRDRNI